MAKKTTAAKKPAKKPVKAKAVKVVNEKDYDKDFEYICREMEKGMALRKVCPAFMGLEKFYKLLAESEEKTKRYARACEGRADAIFEDIIEIADDSASDKYVDDNGYEKTDNEAIQRSKLRVDARKWMLSKLAPKKYGDKLEVDANVKAEVTTIVSLGSGINPNETPS